MSGSEGERWRWRWRRYWPVAVIFLAVIAVQAVLGWLIWLSLPDWPKRSAFGDMFGAVNTLFSGLAFAGFLVTVLLQQQELALQRAELRLTRTELQRQATAQEQSEAALRAQVETGRLSAKLNALSALLSRISQELAVYGPGRAKSRHQEDLQDRQRELEEQINNLLAQLGETDQPGEPAPE